MRFRSVCTFIALSAVLWTSGCCFDHCCHRRERERDCGCECSCAAPCTTCCGAPPLAPPVIPAPTPVMPGVAH